MANTKNHPFDVVEFIRDNKELVKKYLKKNTLKLQVDDFVDIDRENLYQGNPNILKNNDFQYSLLQKLEYVKCMKSCEYFTRKYVRIISIDDGIIKFNLYDYQAELLNLYQNNRYVISTMCRQSGKTQTTAAFILWFSLFTPSKTCAILANKASQAREILSRIQMSYELLPSFLKQPVQYYNKGSMKFKNMSEVFCAATSSSSIRGKSCALVYIDECAFLPNDIEFYESTYPTISSGKESRIIISSTPNGARGLFHKIWSECENKVNAFVGIKVPWNKVPGRDEAWKREQIQNTSQEQFDQEHGLKFRGSSDSLISGHVLETLVKFRPIKVLGDLKVYEEAQQNHIYVSIVDVSRGLGKDYSAIVTFDVTTIPYKVVAVYKNNRISPMVLPQVLLNIVQKYNNAYTLIEVNDIGGEVADLMYYELEYENILCSYSTKHEQKVGFSGEAKPGIRTSTKVKSIGCSNIKTLIEEGKLELRDEELIEEYGTFVPKGKSYEAAKGAHDDLAMCGVLFAWLTTQQFFVDLTDKDIRRDISDSAMDRMYDDLVPFGIIDNGFETYIPETPSGVLKEHGEFF